MAHKKGQGSSRNGRDSNPQHLGVKRFGGQAVTGGTITNGIKVPALAGEAAEKLGPYVKLASRLGKLLGQLEPIEVSELRVTCTGEAGEFGVSPVANAALAGYRNAPRGHRSQLVLRPLLPKANHETRFGGMETALWVAAVVAPFRAIIAGRFATTLRSSGFASTAFPLSMAAKVECASAAWSPAVTA